MTTISIIQVDPSSPLLDEVIRLGDENQATLGFLPDAAFKQYAENGGMLAAIDELGNLAGYLLFRTPQTTNHATIAYLCVRPAYRIKGVSELLFAELRERTKLLYGIDLYCRRDYEAANQLWRRLGFQPGTEKPGRGKRETTLTHWWYQHPHITLFDLTPPADQKTKVVIDANIFIDFCNPDHASEESRALLADSLVSQLQYLVTPELPNEINRQENKNVRQHQQRILKSYDMIKVPHEQFAVIEAQLREKYHTRALDHDISDLAHLAWTIAAPGVGFFVTRDDKLLGIAFDIYKDYQVRMFRPTNLILHLHELSRVKEYQHMRLAGTNLKIRQVKAEEDARLAQVFQYTDRENQAAFLSHLRGFLSNPTATPCFIIEDEGAPLVLFTYQRSDNDLRIPLFRVNFTTPQKGLVRYLLLRFVTTSANEGRNFTCIIENTLHQVIQEALQEDTFQWTRDSWIKPNLSIAAPAQEIANVFERALELHPNIGTYYQMHLQVLRQPENLANVKMMAELERTLYPAKITDAELTSVLIPIDETWISLWFDEKLAAATLFGADKRRAFNREGVYYSKANRAGLETPGRLLWYVTKKSCVRACARLDEVVRGSARDLFQEYKHLGIYEWADLMQLTANNPEAILTAFRFSDPQLFSHSVTSSELTKIYRDETNRNAPIYSASRIPTNVFVKVYRLGMELAE